MSAAGDLDARLLALAEACALARGRLDAGAVAAAQAVVDRAGVRLGLGVEDTVVALAGPTGAGKSSLFNALAGRELVRAGVRRPTTSSVTAAVWGSVSGDLLDWLRAVTRHVVSDGAGPEAGLVVLDLPDYDSVETAHRDEVDRVVELADLLVWVVDPQKYADAALHDGYLRRLSGHRDSMVVVLNQADRLGGRELAACRADVARLLAGDGLDGMPVLPVSALTGDGLPELRAEVRTRVAGRGAAVARLTADVRAAAEGLAAGCGDGRGRRGGGGIQRADRERLVGALAEAAGVPVVVDAVAAAHRRSGRLATGWPYARWLGRLRPDPLRRLRVLERPDPATHTSLPRATPVQQAQVASAARTLAGQAADGLPEPWPRLVRDAAGRHEAQAPGRLDRAVAATDVQPRRPRWWGTVAAVQTALALVAGAGLLWLVAIAALGFLHLDDAVPLPEAAGIPVPTLLLGAGVLGGLVVALVARQANAAGGARRARRAAGRLHEAVGQAAQELVLEPVEAELAARDELCRAVARARSPG